MRAGYFLLLLPLLAAAAPDVQAAQRCPDGRFVTDDASMAVMLESGHVALSNTCPAVPARTRRTRAGMAVKALWRDCAGRVRLKARIDQSCGRMKGFVKRAGIRHRFTAHRAPECGNGVREGAEPCDGGSCCDPSCHEVEGCSRACSSIRDCERGERCEKRPGDCAGNGVCRKLPACDGVVEPVCGCDGKTYANACEATRAGKTVQSLGNCGAACGTLGGKECAAGEFCELQPGTCDVIDLGGICRDVPARCPTIYQPVCGCDGVTYDNDCVRRGKAVAKDHDGQCVCPAFHCDPGKHQRDDDGDGCPDTCDGCRSNDECGADHYCDGPCGRIGECVPRPGPCPLDDNAVCGCDRQTYANACTAASAGVRVAHPGKCECATLFCSPDTVPVDQDHDGCPDHCLVPCKDACDCYDDRLLQFPQPCPLRCATCGNFWECKDGYCNASCGPVPPGVDQCSLPDCGSDAECGPREFCAKRGCAGRGLCQPKGGACPAIYDPVCGCDGRTYASACEATAHGVSVAADGPCREQACGTLAGIPCPPGEFCELPTGTCEWADLGGRCVPAPPACPEFLQLVCGCDGTTYANDCARRRAYVQKASEGPCFRCVPLHCPPGSDVLDSDGDGCLDTCLKVGCLTNGNCGGRLFCAAAEGQCGGEGVCQARPDECSETWLPVCGCNGRTYGNACLADAAGVRVARQGSCQTACVDACDCNGLPLAGECPLLCPGCGSFWSCQRGWCVEQCGIAPETPCLVR